ncbi:hypothetical protein D3C86_1386260 [compost metagenome]
MALSTTCRLWVASSDSINGNPTRLGTAVAANFGAAVTPGAARQMGALPKCCAAITRGPRALRGNLK